MLDAPFFGRIDFQYEGEEEPESFYIGIGTFAERNGALPLIYDWRSPVSSLFYDYEKGPASYEAPVGRCPEKSPRDGSIKSAEGKWSTHSKAT